MRLLTTVAIIGWAVALLIGSATAADSTTASCSTGIQFDTCTVDVSNIDDRR